MKDLILPGILFACMELVFIPSYLVYPRIARGEKKKTKKITSLLKFLCISLPLTVSAIAAFFDTESVSFSAVLVFCGMLLGAAGDVFIDWSFITGLALFLAGHVVYTAAFLSVSGFSPFSLIVFAVVFAALFVFAVKVIPPKKENLPMYVYGAVISNMFSVAVSPLISGREYAAVLASGALMFLISDVFVAMGTVKKLTPLKNAVCLVLYFTGQFLIALFSYLSL